MRRIQMFRPVYVCDQCFREPRAGYTSNERVVQEIRQGSNTSLIAVTMRCQSIANLIEIISGVQNILSRVDRRVSLAPTRSFTTPSMAPRTTTNQASQATLVADAISSLQKVVGNAVRLCPPNLE